MASVKSFVGALAAGAVVVGVAAAGADVVGGRGGQVSQFSPAAVTTRTVNVRSGLKAYALELHRQGLADAEVGAMVASRLESDGVGSGAARALGLEMAMASHGRRGRDPDTLRTVRIGLASRPNQAKGMGNLIAAALCSPVSGENGNGHPSAVSCRARESNYLSEEWCRPGTGTVLARAARSWVTADESSRLRSVYSANPNLSGITDATDANHQALVDLVAGESVERCEPQP